MDYAVSYQHIVDEAGEAEDRIQRAIRGLEKEAREECGEFFDDHDYDVTTEIVEHPAVVEAIVYSRKSEDDADAGRKLKRAVAMARLKFVNDNWSRWAEFAVTRTPKWSGGYIWPRGRTDFLDAMAMRGAE